MNLTISVTGPASISKQYISALKQAVTKTLALSPRSKTSFLKNKSIHWELSVSLVSESKIKSLNHRFRKKNRVTDVLSFSQLDKSWPVSPIQSFGEVIICLPVAKKQALLFKQTLLRELERLTVHGTLHLLGYDHELGKKEELEMFRLQDQILQNISLKHLKT